VISEKKRYIGRGFFCLRKSTRSYRYGKVKQTIFRGSAAALRQASEGTGIAGASPGHRSEVGIDSDVGVMVLRVGVGVCLASMQGRFAALPLGCLGLHFLPGSHSSVASAAACAALQIHHFFEVIRGRLLISCNHKSVPCSSLTSLKVPRLYIINACISLTIRL
jgi:hypothetical protein